jgi:hypothetical protein
VDVAGETSSVEIQMPLIVGTVPLHREFSKLQPAMVKDYKSYAAPLIPQTMDTKYKKLREFCYKCILMRESEQSHIQNINNHHGPSDVKI